MASVSPVQTASSDLHSKPQFSLEHLAQVGFKLFRPGESKTCAECIRTDKDISRYAIEIIETGTEDETDAPLTERTAFHIACFWEDGGRKLIGKSDQVNMYNQVIQTFAKKVDCHFEGHPPTAIIPSYNIDESANQQEQMQRNLSAQWKRIRGALIRFVLHYQKDKSFYEIRELFFRMLGNDFAHPFYRRKVEDSFSKTQKILIFMNRNNCDPVIPDDCNSNIFNEINRQKKSLRQQQINPDEEIDSIKFLLKICNNLAVELKLLHFSKSDEPMYIKVQICPVNSNAYDSEEPGSSFQCSFCDSSIQKYAISGEEVVTYDGKKSFKNCFKQAFFHIGCFMSCLDLTHQNYPGSKIKIDQVSVKLDGYPPKSFSTRKLRSQFQGGELLSQDEYLKRRNALLTAFAPLLLHYWMFLYINKPKIHETIKKDIRSLLEEKKFFKFSCDEEIFEDAFLRVVQLIEKENHEDDGPEELKRLNDYIGRLKSTVYYENFDTNEKVREIVRCNELFRKLYVDHELHTQVFKTEQEAMRSRNRKVLSLENLQESFQDSMTEAFRDFLQEEIVDDDDVKGDE